MLVDDESIIPFAGSPCVVIHDAEVVVTGRVYIPDAADVKLSRCAQDGCDMLVKNAKGKVPHKHHHKHENLDYRGTAYSARVSPGRSVMGVSNFNSTNSWND